MASSGIFARRETRLFGRESNTLRLCDSATLRLCSPKCANLDSTEPNSRSGEQHSPATHIWSSSTFTFAHHHTHSPPIFSEQIKSTEALRALDSAFTRPCSTWRPPPIQHIPCHRPECHLMQSKATAMATTLPSPSSRSMNFSVFSPRWDSQSHLKICRNRRVTSHIESL